MLRFDEVMTQKASKISVEDRILDVQRKYDPKIADVYHNLEIARVEREEYVAGFDKFVKLVNDRIYDAVNKVSKRMNVKSSASTDIS